ncbi:MAG: hypothetical protein ACYTDY_00940 [Planctomycetota bacterium]|jgi:hypothetical protein
MRRTRGIVLVVVMATGCRSLVEHPVSHAFEEQPGRLVRGYVTSDGEEHVEEGYLHLDDRGVVTFRPVDSAAVRTYEPGDVDGILVRGRSRVGKKIVSGLEVVGVAILVVGIVALSVYLDLEYETECI